MHAIYEGDVRFEHCMALDLETHVRPSIRRACWAEWVAFYTYGQTRDRVLHAHLRVKQLSSVSDSLAPPWSQHDDHLGGASRCGESCDYQQPLCTNTCEDASCDDACAAEHRSCLRRCM